MASCVISSSLSLHTENKAAQGKLTAYSPLNCSMCFKP